MDAGAARDAYLALGAQLGRWQARQSDGSTIISTVCDFHARLQLVSRSRAPGAGPGVGTVRGNAASVKRFGVLATDMRVVDVLRHKHEIGMHNLVAAMHRTVDDLSAVRDRLGELTTEAWRAHGSRELSLGETAEPLWTTVPGALGVALRERIKLPSIAQLLEDHLALDRSLGEELRLKRQIAARLSNDMSAIEMCELARLWALQPYLDTERVAFVNALARCFVS